MCGSDATFAKGVERMMEALRQPKARVAVLYTNRRAYEWVQKQIFRTYGEEFESANDPRDGAAKHRAGGELFFYSISARYWHGERFTFAWLALPGDFLDLLASVRELEFGESGLGMDGPCRIYAVECPV